MPSFASVALPSLSLTAGLAFILAKVKRRRPGRRTARRLTGMDMQCLHALCSGKLRVIYPLATPRQSAHASCACICPKETAQTETPLRMQHGINTPEKHACATSTSGHDYHRERDASELLPAKLNSAGVFKTDSDTLERHVKDFLLSNVGLFIHSTS